MGVIRFGVPQPIAVPNGNVVNIANVEWTSCQRSFDWATFSQQNQFAERF
jgi:hypothetical protein